MGTNADCFFIDEYCTLLLAELSEKAEKEAKTKGTKKEDNKPKTLAERQKETAERLSKSKNRVIGD